MRVCALCGSLRAGSYNQALLNAAIQMGPYRDLDIVQVEIRDFPLFNQDFESTPPRQVTAAKEAIATADCILLATPEHDYGVPAALKNAIEWLSRPTGDPTLRLRPMALMGASTGYMGTIRAQMAWRQMWHYFNQPVFSGFEMTFAFAKKSVDENGVVVDAEVLNRLGIYLDKLSAWLVARR